MDGIGVLAGAEEILAKFRPRAHERRNNQFHQDALGRRGSLITGVEVTEAVKHLRSGRAPGVHKIP